jgi:hypothetical protein
MPCLSRYPYVRLAVGEYRVIYRFDAANVRVLAHVSAGNSFSPAITSTYVCA